MIHNQREKRLGVLLGMILLIVFGDHLIDRLLVEPLDRKSQRLLVLQSEVANQRQKYQHMRRTTHLRDEAMQTALPSNPAVATTLYQQWLIEMAKDVAISQPQIAPSRPVFEESMGYRLPFTFRAELNESQLWNVLERIDQLPTLHAITSIVVAKESAEQNRFRVTLGIDAISLANCQQPADYSLITLESEEEPRQIVEQDYLATRLFTPAELARRTTPSTALRPKPRPQSPTKQAPDFRLVGTLTEGTTARAWFVDRNTGQNHVGQLGSTIDLDDVNATIVAVEPKFIRFRIDHRLYHLPLGKCLSEKIQADDSSSTVATFRVPPRKRETGVARSFFSPGQP